MQTVGRVPGWNRQSSSRASQRRAENGRHSGSGTRIDTAGLKLGAKRGIGYNVGRRTIMERHEFLSSKIDWPELIRHVAIPCVCKVRNTYDRYAFT